jgi:hypothetical protein
MKTNNCPLTLNCKFNHLDLSYSFWQLFVISGIHVRVVHRQATQQLGANSRDDGLVVSILLQL